jgi:hypothetical protein
MSSLPSSSWDGAVVARAALIDNVLIDTGIVPSGLDPGVAEDLRDVEDHFWRIGSLMLKLIDKYGNQPGDDAISDHIRRAHEDLELKLVKASIQKASVAKDELVTRSRSRSQRSDVVLSYDLADGADVADVADVLPAHGIPDVADVVDIVSGSSNDTEWYPDDPYMS